MKKPLPPTETRVSPKPKPERTAVKVPELAENMEHTLRRLMRDKNKERDRKNGLIR